MKWGGEGCVLGPSSSGAAVLGVETHTYSIRSVLGWSYWIPSGHTLTLKPFLIYLYTSYGSDVY